MLNSYFDSILSNEFGPEGAIALGKSVTGNSAMKHLWFDLPCIVCLTSTHIFIWNQDG